MRESHLGIKKKKKSLHILNSAAESKSFNSTKKTALTQFSLCSHRPSTASLQTLQSAAMCDLTEHIQTARTLASPSGENKAGPWKSHTLHYLRREIYFFSIVSWCRFVFLASQINSFLTVKEENKRENTPCPFTQTEKHLTSEARDSSHGYILKKKAK